ncbi:MAG: hypothetical protein GWN14_15465 [candidate division Zixibacteria bacterium]|nr:hypothetical protein [Gammaproteobacteria bacterium]NIX57280.1 hypothetical protein [candidate division Zixibacteria bacterium]
MIDIVGFLSALTNIPKTIQLIDEQIKRSRGRKRILLIEMKQNISTIKLYTERGAPIDKVILALRTSKLEELLESNFNFNRIEKSKVKEETTGSVPFYKPYIGWSTYQLFENIYLKITDLQGVVKIDTNNPNIRKSVRLINILKLIKLLLVHISK